MSPSNTMFALPSDFMPGRLVKSIVKMPRPVPFLSLFSLSGWNIVRCSSGFLSEKSLE